jgi:hypothetical protein
LLILFPEVDHLHQCQIICWYLPLETPSFLFTDSDTSAVIYVVSSGMDHNRVPPPAFPATTGGLHLHGMHKPTLIMISKPVKILCVSYEVSQKLSEKPRSGGAYPIGPGLSGKTKALRRSS